MLQAEILGKNLSEVKFHRVYSSDYKRAKETAEYILKHSSHPTPEMIVDQRVRERVNSTPTT